MTSAMMITGTHDRDTKGEAELYETPHGATLALLRAHPFFRRPRRLLEPACGPGQIVEVLQAERHDVTAADKFDYEDRWKGAFDTLRTWGRDFLACGHQGGFDGVVMNPPYSRADDFIFAALREAPIVFALLEVGWKQATGMARSELIDDGYLAHEYDFRERLDMHRDGFAEEDKGYQPRKHAWFVFSRTRRETSWWPCERISQVGYLSDRGDAPHPASPRTGPDGPAAAPAQSLVKHRSSARPRHA